ncbi:MAG: hypothetical protein C0485_01715 [Pirellula sp.]|nr:hypothetical protein [Pirellula sp.]
MISFSVVRSFARNRCLICATAVAACVGSIGTARGEWIRNYGTGAPDFLTDVSADGLGSVYVSGSATASSRQTEALLLKYDDAGNLKWAKKYRERNHHFSEGVAADGLGNVYVAGHTYGISAGDLPAAHVGKFDANGTQIWSRLLESGAGDYATGVAVDGTGSLYISGYTQGNLNGFNKGGDDAFLSKYAVDGSLLWTQQFGTSGYDQALGVAVDGLGSVYIAGRTKGNQFGVGSDAFLNKYDAAGTLLWDRELSTPGQDVNTGVSVDSLGNIYLSGYTDGSLGGPNAGGFDAMLSKYAADGTSLWTQQLGTGASDKGLDVSTDALGNAFLSGETMGSLGGPQLGAGDAFLSSFAAAGTLQWTRQLGSVSPGIPDDASGVAADGTGGAYIAGTTFDLGGGPSVPGGSTEGYVARIGVPEPSALALLFAATPLMLAVRRRSRI